MGAFSLIVVINLLKSLTMPPKQQASKKTEEKKKEKVIEDKTFGLKNKKGAKQQKFIQQVQSQVKQQSVTNAKSQEEKKKAEKDKKQKELDELNALFKSVEQTAPKGVDPKSIVCEMFKKAKCTKGDKCKFSHDLNVNRKTQKINVFEDKRDAQKGPLLPETFACDDPTKTDIVCKYFLEAVEKKLYGWFWQCPNGGNQCKYRHALPEGYVLKNQKKDDGEQEQQISLEDLIEKERAMITDTTKITLKTFLIWKKKKLKERAEQKKTETAKKQADFKKDKTQGLSGREMFTFQASQGSVDDDDTGGDGQVVEYNRDDENEDGEGAGINSGPVREINLEEFSMQIIEENEAELARQELAGENGKSPKKQRSSPEKQTPDQPSSSKATDGAGPSTSQNPGVALPDDGSQPGPSTNGVAALEIDEELFEQEINELDDLDLSDDEDDETN